MKLTLVHVCENARGEHPIIIPSVGNVWDCDRSGITSTFWAGTGRRLLRDHFSHIETRLKDSIEIVRMHSDIKQSINLQNIKFPSSASLL